MSSIQMDSSLKELSLLFTYYVEARGNRQTMLFQPSSCASLLGNFGNNQMARVSNLTEERARITYPEGTKARIVKSVEWLQVR
ncbi:MAG: hypothetical protein ACLS3S_08560 [Streptococcus salivarius]